MPTAPAEPERVAGRYRVIRELARGGVGAVYEALDESTGKRVALKRLIHDAVDKPRLALLFQSEYDTLARLRHPRIVEVYDYGIDKRGPYFTMELLDGQDLSELEPIPYRDACRYLRDVASSLALLHTRRRLHRDLSPRNVRLTSDGRCRLLDFGTMASFGVSEDIVGTPPLVPPEALRGSALDHRADLYSLGALLYRVMTSRYPYRARQLEDLPELWRSPPARLRELAPELPAELDELVMSMLSLDPTYRPTTTYEVIDRLTAIGELPPDEDRGLTAQGYLVGSRLIGRVRQMETVQRRIARAHRERGSTIVIEGNPGVGKSRLLDEASLHAQLTGALTVRVDARAHPGEHAVARALVKAIAIAAPHDARDAAMAYARELGLIFAIVGHELPSPSGAEAVSQEPRSLTTARAEQNAALLGWLVDLSEDRTLVLLVDDLPRVDESSAALLSLLAQQIKHRRILFIAARRFVDKAAARGAVEAIVAQARRLRVHRLRRENTSALLEALFGSVPNLDLFANWIHDVTTGSPMQIMELCRHLVRENIVRFVDGLWVLPPTIPRDDLPKNLAATLSARAAALSKSERALAEALCVRRGALSLPLCLKLSDEKETRALFGNLDELVAKGVLVSAANGYHFGQDALREVLLRELPPERARLLHLRLGEALLEAGSERPEDAIEAGFNLLLGGAEERGADLLAQTAPKLAGRGSQTAAALPALEAALELYEKWGRSPRDCLRLREVMVGSMDRRMVALYGDATLAALHHYSGAQLANRLRRWFGSRAALRIAILLGDLRCALTPLQRRGPRPRAAIAALYRAGVGVVSVRSYVIDPLGMERVLGLIEPLAVSGALGRLLDATLRLLLRTLRGQFRSALESGREALQLLRRTGPADGAIHPAARSGMAASQLVALGLVEAQYALHGKRVLAIVEELNQLAKQSRLNEVDALEAGPGEPLSAPELSLMIHQLRLAYHLMRGERSQAEARRAELLMHGVNSGLHYQFDVWRTLLECNMSARALDAASLRRCVEIFTHYVADYPELIPRLEIARAHLAHCLGKPQEALVGYEKWIARTPPGATAGWETLYSGFADALMALGDFARARQFIAELLEHEVLRGGEDNSARVMLEAQLAWAEAETKDLDAAGPRIERLQKAIANADQPLVVGFVHETAARIAHRRRDELARGSHLTAMKRWYSSTRNAALLMRAQRVIESLSEATPPGGRTLSALPQEAERAIVTRVTTRREVTSVEGLFEGASNQKELCEHALHFLVESAGGNSGYLYLRGDDGPQLSASTSGEPDDELERAVQDALARPRDPAGAAEREETAPIGISIEAEGAAPLYGLFLLAGPGQTQAIGAALICSNDEPIRPIATELLQSVARNLSRKD